MVRLDVDLGAMRTDYDLLVGDLTTLTILQQYGPNHLGLC